MYDRTNVLYSSIIAILNKYKFTHIQSIFPRLSSPGNGSQLLRWVHLSDRGPELINSWQSYLLNCKLRPRMPAYRVSATSGRRGRGWHDTEWQRTRTRTVTIRLSLVHSVWCKICMQPGFLVDVRVFGHPWTALEQMTIDTHLHFKERIQSAIQTGGGLLLLSDPPRWAALCPWL